MGELRKRMDGDLVVRGMALRTREAYLGAVAGLAKYYKRRPDRIGEAEMQKYLVYLIEERKLAWSSCNVVTQGLKFFYRVTLKRSEAQFVIPRARTAQKLPQILSREEVAALLQKTVNPKHRAVLMSAYGAGLRLNEICHLKLTDIDSDRMTLRVEQGKGARRTATRCSRRGCSRSYANTGSRIGPRHGSSRLAIRRGRSTTRPCSVSSTPPRTAPESTSNAASTACAMRSRRTCWRRAWTCTPSSA